MNRREFLRMLGLSVGVALTGCGGGGSGNAPSNVVPNAYRFVPLLNSGQALSQRARVRLMAADGQLPFMGPVSVNDLRHVAFHAADEEGLDGVYRFEYDTGGAISPVQCLLKEGDELIDGGVVEDISPGCVNNSDGCAYVVRDTEGRQTLQVSEGDGFRKLLTPYEDVTGQVRLYGDLHPEVSISDGADLMFCSNYRDEEGLCKGQGLFYLPRGQKSQAHLVLSRDELLPGTRASVRSFGIFDLQDGGNYLLHGTAAPIEGEIDGAGTLTYLLQGRVGESPETLFAHPALGARAAIQGTIHMAPRLGPQRLGMPGLGTPGFGVVVQSGVDQSALYLGRTKVLGAGLEGGTRSPRGSRIISLFPPVFAAGGQVFVQVFTEDGMEILAANRIGFSTVLATGDTVGEKTVTSLMFGIAPESVNSRGEFVCIAWFADGTSSIVLGIPV